METSWGCCKKEEKTNGYIHHDGGVESAGGTDLGEGADTERGAGEAGGAAVRVEKVDDVHGPAQDLWKRHFPESGGCGHVKDQQGGVYKQKGRAVSAGEPQRLPAEFRGRIFKEKEAQQKRYRGAGDTDRGV